tara:strand:+ start:39 stop:392 length:354 start_codon:yes stop_codon:yes gene_type:complete
MKIFEIFNKEIEDKMPYDVVDDVHFHLLNDDMFYRKYYLPCMEKIRAEKNEKVIQGHMDPMIHKGINHYVIKYDIDKTPSDLMTPEEVKSLKDRVLDHERNPDKELQSAPETNIRRP